ncbi:hypothetical protein E2542_SST13448 [Spatholobus suberectus]|nr:hypothetical protein E2542_SST13448 [Spatholobus suberectus]
MDPNKHEFPLPNLAPSPRAQILTCTAPAPLRRDALHRRRTWRHLVFLSLYCPSSFPTPRATAVRVGASTGNNIRFRVELASAFVRSHFLRHCADYVLVATHAGSHTFGLHNWNSKPLFLWSVDCCAPLLSNAF